MKNNKSLGQHWLGNRAILDLIADYAFVNADDICLEIGPGLGTLTSSLLKRFQKVIAVEYDARLAANLPGSFPGKNLEVIHADILDFDFTKIKGNYAIAGNIPYYITSPILEKVLTTSHLASRIVLLMQKEVAERITSDKETVLSLFVKNRATVTSGPIVKKDEFTPPPKVDSMILILDPHDPTVDESVFRLIRQGFSAPRKKLIHNLASLRPESELARIFKSINITSDARPGDLHLDDWRQLNNFL